MKKTGLIIVLAVMLLACSCTSTYHLAVVDSDNADVIKYRGVPVASFEDDSYRITVAGDEIDSEEAAFFVSVNNVSSDYGYFEDGSFSLYCGDRLKGNWKYLGTWDADEYYKQEKKNVENEKFFTAVAGVLDVLSVAADTPDEKNYDNKHNYKPNEKYEDEVFFAAFDAAITNRVVEEAGDEYLAFLEDNLLYESFIIPGYSYSGWMFFDVNKAKGNDFLLHYEGLHGDTDIYFQKTED